MKISLKKIELISVAVLYIAALYLWTLPIQKNSMPFGDVDASSHFAVGDYISANDRSIAKVPYYIFSRYGGQNAAFPGYLWYAPQYWTNLGISQVLGGGRIIPFFIMIAIFSSLTILSAYFLMRRLFGFWPAFLSSFLLIFSTRDYMVYLWGQWPQALSFAFTPIALYCFYQYYKEGMKPIYLYFLALFLSAQFFFHPQGLIASAGALIALSLILLVRDKKIPFSFKHLLISVILFLLISAAFAPFNFGSFFIELTTGQPEQVKSYQLDKLFRWYQGIKNDPGLPDFYFKYNNSHGSLNNSLLSWWTLPFLLAGILVLAIRRKDEDFVLLSWLISFYFLTRLTVFGYGARDIRMFAYEAHVFYPIIAIGLVSLSSIPKQAVLKKYLKYGLIALFIVLAVSVNGKSAYDVLKSQQNSIGRINPWQYETAEWLKSNTDEMSDIYDCGTLGFQNYAAKIKWFGVLSQRHFVVEDKEISSTDYVLVDYTDALLLKNQDYANFLQNYEASFQNSTPVYNKNNVRLYKTNGAVKCG